MYVTHLTPILNVTNLAASVEWFEHLGWRKCWEWRPEPAGPASFGAVGSGQCEIFLCVDGQGGRGRSELARTSGPGGDDSADRGVWISVWVEKVDEVHARCIERGVEVTWPPTDEPWGVREMHVRHPDGHVLRISERK
ncbi:MAG: bleomycin resistance family protein [Phycisphaerales bacterium]|nr:bleomycin resistance family protein [Phycisphaerales bacterium]